jgi:serine protease
MQKPRSPLFWRALAAAALALSALPLWWGRPSVSLVPRPVDAEQTWEVPGEIVADVRDDATQADLNALAMRHQFTFAPEDLSVNRGRILRISCPPAAAAALLTALRADPMVEAAEPQRLFRLIPDPAGQNYLSPPLPPRRQTPEPNHGGWRPNDPRYPEQWNFARIQVEEAWARTRGKGAVVAVIDTGVALQYADRGYLCRDFKQTDFVHPYDFVHRDRNPMDDNGHGTHVAGTIAESTDNHEGVAGIAFEAKIMPLKVLTREGFGRMSDVAAAIRYAADKGAHIINLSLGSPFPDAITRGAIEYAHRRGVTIIAAAGNSGGQGVSFPAAYPQCIAVSALGPTGELAPYSSWGPEVAISAPGGDKTRGEEAGILQNTYLRQVRHSAQAEKPTDPSDPDPARRLEETQVDDYFAFQGTSMATPHVAGVAALVVSMGVRDPQEIRAVLLQSAKPRGPKEKYGAGELNAGKAVAVAAAFARDYYARLWLIGALWLGCLVIGRIRKPYRTPAPFASTLALTIGLLLPDLISALADFGSLWNLIGHSILVPGFLLISEAESRAEHRFYAMMAFGMVAHLAWDLLSGTAPFAGNVHWAALPWLWTNIAVGMGVILSGLRRA